MELRTSQVQSADYKVYWSFFLEGWWWWLLDSSDKEICHFQELTVSMFSTASFMSGLSRIVTCIYMDCRDHIAQIVEKIQRHPYHIFYLLLRTLGHFALRSWWFRLLGSGCGEFDPWDEKDHLSIIISNILWSYSVAYYDKIRRKITVKVEMLAMIPVSVEIQGWWYLWLSCTQ